MSIQQQDEHISDRIHSRISQGAIISGTESHARRLRKTRSDQIHDFQSEKSEGREGFAQTGSKRQRLIFYMVIYSHQ